jgi:hypothetical protein
LDLQCILRAITLSWLLFGKNCLSQLTKLKKTFCFCSWTSTLLFLIDIILSFSYPFFFPSFFYPAQSWSWGGIYRVLGGLEFISDLLILRGVLWTLEKDLLKSLCIWTHENQIVFCVIIMFSGLTELPTFEVSSEQFWRHRHLRPPGCGRGGAYLSFGSNLTWFRGL